MSWPGFYSSVNGWLFALLIPLIIFYFLKLRRPRLEISSLALWRQVINDQRVNSPFQRFKRHLLLLLQIALLCLLSLAAMQPFVRAAPQRAVSLVVLIDTSASMGAVDQAGGRSRLDAAREQVARLIENLLPDQQLSLVAFHSTPQRLTEFTDNKQLLRDALGRLKPSDMPSRVDDALRLTQAMIRSQRADSVESVVLITDGNVPEAVDFDLPFELKVQLVGPAGPNLGITAVNAHRAGPNMWEVFARIEASGSGQLNRAPAAKAGEPAAATTKAAGAEVELLQEGADVKTTHVEVDPGKSVRLLFKVRGGPPGSLQIRLKPDGFDSLAADNIAYLELPALRPLQLYVSNELTIYRHALKALKDLEIYPREDGQKAIRYDLTISASATDAALDSPVSMLVGVIPEDLKTVLGVRAKLATVVDWRRASPLLQHVQLADVQAAEEPYFLDAAKPEDRNAELEEAGYEVLIDGRSGPLLMQKQMGPKLQFISLFHTDKSTLPYRVGFPVLVANLVNIAMQQASLSEVQGAATGLFPPIKLRPNVEYVVKSPDDTQVTVHSNEESRIIGVSTPRAGRYAVSDAGREVASVGVSLLNARESSLVGLPLGAKGQPLLQFRETAVAAEADQIDNDRPLWPTLSMLAFFVLIGEWWLFQKKPG